MTITTTARLLPLPLLVAACGAVDAATPSPSPSPSPIASAGDVAAAAAPDRDDHAIAALRARGRAGLDELLARYDRMPAGAARTALAATIDRVAAQRYATASRLYWYTDLGAAKAEAARTGKPILSLKLLGRLDEDLSCANSRFFRTVLYPDPAVAKLLRDGFVLHWSSERAVPRVTIDFGDGRKLERTITGNSIHYVLDAQGRPIDALPGLYAPAAFVAELERSRALHAELARAGDYRGQVLYDHHRLRYDERNRQFAAMGSVAVVRGLGRLATVGDFEGALMQAQLATTSKAVIEVPQIAMFMEVGADPNALAADVDVWGAIGMHLYGIGTPPTLPKPLQILPRDMTYGAEIVRAPRRVIRGKAAPPDLPRILSEPARRLVTAIIRATPAGVPAMDDPSLARVIAKLEQTLVADSAQNELQLRQRIREEFMRRGAEITLDGLNRHVYDVVFTTPATDPWLGLLPRDAFTGLPGDGAVTTAVTTAAR